MLVPLSAAFPAAALLAAAFASPAASDSPARGPVALLAEPFVLDGAARDALLGSVRAGSDGTRILLTLGAQAVLDPLEDGAARTLRIDVTRADADADRAWSRALRACDAVVLSGGTWLGWHEAATVSRRERRWARALRAAHEQGTPVVAVGSAASWIARWSIAPRASLRRPAQDPHDRSTFVAVEGLGLVDGPLVGIVGADDATAALALERGVAHGWQDVLILDGASCWIAGAARPERAQVHGSGTAAWIRLGAGTRSRDRIRGARAAVFADGEAWDGRAHVLDGAPRRGASAPDRSGGERLREMLLGAAPEGAWRAIESARIHADERTRQHASGGWSDLVLDLVVGPR